jgi:uncharacterized protein YjdB
MKRFMFAVAVAALLFGFASCVNDASGGSDTPASVAVTGITVTSPTGESTGSILKDGTLQLTAAVTPDNASNKTVTWTSSAEDVATVNSDGLVTGVKVSAEAVTITASAGDGSGVAGTFSLTVTDASVPVTSITVTAAGNAVSVENGKTLQLSAEIAPSTATNTAVTWSSSDETSATVDSTGLVTAKAVTAKVTITATAADGSGVKGTIDLAVTKVASTVEALPVIPAGNQVTKIEGAGIWIYLDNTNLGITGANAADVLSGLTIAASDTATGNAVTISGSEFNDYGTNTVRLYLTMPDAAHTSITVSVSGTINGTAYAGDVEFVSGVYQFDYTPVSLALTPASSSLNHGAICTFKVVGTPYNIDVTSKCTFTIAAPDATGSSMNANVFTAGTTDGTANVTASYKGVTSSAAVMTISSSALPQIMDTSKIEGAGIMIYIDKAVCSTAPAKANVTATGSLATTDAAYTSYVTDNLALTVADVVDQGSAIYIYITQPAGFPNGAAITENITLSWTGCTVKAQFDGNVLTSSSVSVQ